MLNDLAAILTEERQSLYIKKRLNKNTNNFRVTNPTGISIADNIITLLWENKQLTSAEIVKHYLNKCASSDTAIYAALSFLVKKNVITRVSRGVYAG